MTKSDLAKEIMKHADIKERLQDRVFNALVACKKQWLETALMHIYNSNVGGGNVCCIATGGIFIPNK